MALITDESGNAEYPQTYTSKVFDKNGNAINDRVVYGEPDGSVSVEPMSPILHQSDVVNDLTSTSTTTPLSAAMGTALNSTLEGLQTSTLKYQSYTLSANATTAFSVSSSAYALITTIGAASARCTIASMVSSGTNVYLNTLITGSNISYSTGTSSFSISNTSNASTRIEIIVFDGEIVKN